MYFNPQGGRNEENSKYESTPPSKPHILCTLHLLPVMNFTILASSYHLETVVNIPLSNVCLADFL